ncbi:ER lumen protein-retaining receptor isoform X2 [Dendrobium catenatum]|uniref:ER lumen protein-retaining receptor isoform X2 n=1 Tax=Dendrobium catenatum TaxID=906689 RepID=UPI0009F175F9|nr:ER lumen protein-retaining receptor isoform X2 [Dendrobium catenatum]
MNAFRLAGDMTHLLSIILLLLKIRATKSCAGISLKTQELYVIVFMSRYLDLFRTYYSLYNSLMKIIFLGTSMCIVWYMRSHKILWTFSLYLESVAILPQLVLLQKSSNIDNLTGTYVFLLGAYRGLYLFNWVYRFFTENHRVRWIPWLSGLIQTAIYTDFFYYYIRSWKNREKLKLPA